MARLPRIVIPNQPLHIMHRGNNRQDIFECEGDMLRFKEGLKISLSKSNCKLHAYVIMTNHVHLLVTPEDESQLKVFMQSVANRYVRYFNAKNHRTGTIWEGRYKSCLIDSDHYLLTLYQYIEMNPVEAHMVKRPADYKWSSYRHNALGESDDLVTEHEIYKSLGTDGPLRYRHYQSLFDTAVAPAQSREITEATLRGEVYGSEGFHQKISTLITRATRLTAHGGDRKSESYENQAG